MSLLHQLALTRLPGIGPVLARKLLDHYGDEEVVFREAEKDLLKLAHQGKRIARSFRPSTVSRAMKEAGAELDFIDRAGIRMVYFRDSNYPRRLKECDDAPLVLFCRGHLLPDHPRILSIVGSRKATPEGRRLCDSLVSELRPYGPLIVSGLAYGIDVAAHEAALKNDLPTLGVLGHGLSHLYPAAHRRISREMTGKGGLLTEWHHDVPASPGNFPRRNRIIAGLADATIVVEARSDGGALITADIASSYHRDVFAFPARVGDENARGCLELIRDHRAQLITGVEDLIWQLGWDPVGREDSPKSADLGDFSKDERHIICIISENEGISLDKLLIVAEIPKENVHSALISLEIRGFVYNIPGKGYVLM